MDGLLTVDVFSFWDSVVAQATPSSSPDLPQLTGEIEALKDRLQLLQQMNEGLSESLKSQIEFLKAENTALANSFSKFVEAMKWIVTTLSVLAVILTAILGFIFGKNLEDAKKVARETIAQQVEGQISTLVNERVEDVRRTLLREQVIGQTLVDYYLPNGSEKPKEFDLVNARGFQNVRFRAQLGDICAYPGDVVILDLPNWVVSSGKKFLDLEESDRETHAQQQIDGLLDLLPVTSVLVVYIRGTVKYLNSISDRYVLPANNPVTLIGNCADGAYVVKGASSS